MKEHGGNYLSLTTTQSDDFAVSMGELEQLEAAFTQFHEQKLPPPGGFFVDKVLSLRLEYGNELTIPVSKITYFAPNTVESREQQWQHQRACDIHRRSIHPEGT